MLFDGCVFFLFHNGTTEITLNFDIILNDDEISKYLKGIKLDIDNLVIDGNNHTIDAKGETQIFFCLGRNITIKNVKFKNGFSEENGGAIFNNEQSSLEINNCKFTKNTAISDGGAIYNSGSLTIKDSTLNSNEAESLGGAICIYYGVVTVRESTLTENAASLGGAIYSEAELTVDACAFTENTARKDGGAIDNWNGESTVTACSFTKNTVHGFGGAIHSRGSFTIRESTLRENTALTYGGAIIAVAS